MLHYLDDLDSKMEAMRAHFERELGLDGPWTGYNSSLGRPLLNSAKFLDKNEATATAAGSSGEDSAVAETSTVQQETATPQAMPAAAPGSKA